MIRDGSVGTAMIIGYTGPRTSVRRDGATGRRLVGGIVECRPDRLRSMDAEPTFTRVARTTIIKTIKGGFLCDVLQWRFTEASTSSARPFVMGASDSAAVDGKGPDLVCKQIERDDLPTAVADGPVELYCAGLLASLQ